MLTKELALEYLRINDGEKQSQLLEIADGIREEFVGTQVCVHGIIEFSNYCRSQCMYCGIRSENKELTRYRMTPEQIIDVAVQGANVLGYKMIVMQSGEDMGFDVAMLARVVREIRAQCKVLIFLSIGERDRGTYETLYAAGARGSLFRFETSDATLFKRMHPDSTLDERLAHIRWLEEAGFLMATGPIIGLPGQTLESLVDDIFLIRDFKAMMATMGPFVPTQGTPLAGETAGSTDLALKMIALTRLIYPKVRIPITTALETLGGPGVRRRALNGGGNAFMLNLTPPEFRGNYQIYAGKNDLKWHIATPESQRELIGLIHDAGRVHCKTFGKDFTLTAEGFASACGMGPCNPPEVNEDTKEE